MKYIYIYRYIEIWCWTNGFGIPHSQTNPMSQRKRWEMYSIILIVWDNKCVYISIYTKKKHAFGTPGISVFTEKMKGSWPEYHSQTYQLYFFDIFCGLLCAWSQQWLNREIGYGEKPVRVRSPYVQWICSFLSPRYTSCSLPSSLGESIS